MLKNVLMLALVSLVAFSSCSGEDAENSEGAEVANAVAGTYTGTGQVAYFGGSENCSSVRMILSAQGTRFTIEERTISCDTIKTEIEEPIVLEVRGNSLLYKNTVVGSLTNSKFELQYSDDGYKVAVKLEFNGTAYIYSEAWTGADPQQNMQFNGALTKK